MFKKKEKEFDLLNDFMLGEDEDREIRETFGKYEVYEMNDDDRLFIAELLEQHRKEDKEIIDSADLLIQLLERLTNLPEKILNKNAFEKIQKKPKKVFRQIVGEVEEMFSEFCEQLNKNIVKLEKMPPALRKKQLENVEKLLKKEEKKKIELTPEEIEKYKLFQEQEGLI